jgi:extradiol dioxygenase family protein
VCVCERERECVCVVIQHAKARAPYYAVIFDLLGSTIFFHILSQTARFSKTVTEHKMCVRIFSTTFI